MDRKLIHETIGIPRSSLSDWSKREDNNWRKKLYVLLSNIEEIEVNRLIQMGDIKNMSFEELENNINLYVNIKETK